MQLLITYWITWFIQLISWLIWWGGDNARCTEGSLRDPLWWASLCPGGDPGQVVWLRAGCWLLVNESWWRVTPVARQFFCFTALTFHPLGRTIADFDRPDPQPGADVSLLSWEQQMWVFSLWNELAQDFRKLFMTRTTQNSLRLVQHDWIQNIQSKKL